jgi:hypothetical protein
MAGGDPWARVVWVVELWDEGLRVFRFDSAWTDEGAAVARSNVVPDGCVTPVPLDPPPSGNVTRPEIELWKRGGRGRRPGLAAPPGDDAA